MFRHWSGPEGGIGMGKKTIYIYKGPVKTYEDIVLTVEPEVIYRVVYETKED